MNSKKSFLLLCEYLKTGGIETLLLRMANWLVDNNQTVIVFTKECTNELKYLFDSKVKLIMDENYNYIHKNPEYYGIYESADVIYIFSPRDLVLGYLLYSKTKVQSKLLMGVYHPNSIEREKGIFGWKFHFYKYIYNKLNRNKSLIFMNMECFEEHNKFLKSEIAPNIWPLPINTPLEKKRKPQYFKIISIGNLKKFKTYNLSLIPVISNLIKKGFPVTWDIYGAGPLKDQMIKLVNNYKLENVVNIKGQCNYNKLGEILNEAYVFIGVGTTLIEAASFGVPSIGATIDSEKPTSYGYLYELPFGNVGEKILGRVDQSIEELLINLFELPYDEYNIDCEKSREYSKKYSMNSLMPHFFMFIKNASALDSGQKIKQRVWIFYHLLRLEKVIFYIYQKLK